MNLLLGNFRGGSAKLFFFPLPEGEGALAVCKTAEAGEGHTAKNAKCCSFTPWAPHPSLRDTFSLGEKDIITNIEPSGPNI